MRVAIGSDKSGFALKEAVKAYLVSEEARAAGIEFDSGRDDLGTTDIGDVHPYYRVAADVAPRVLSGEYDRAVLICGTGAGMSVVANKFKGLSAVACEGVYSAKMARVTHVGIEEWRKEWLSAADQKVAAIEEENFKG